jgi:hypothetical protein
MSINCFSAGRVKEKWLEEVICLYSLLVSAGRVTKLPDLRDA